MGQIKSFCKALTENKYFEWGITLIILINSALIGVETYSENTTIKLIQQIILYIFTIEIVAKYIAADSAKNFFTDGWCIFDLLLVLIGYIPDSLFANASTLMALRTLRVFRVLRLLRAAKELKLIVTVLMRSMSAMFYNLVLFLIFVYLYAIVGVSLFRLPDPKTLDAEQLAKYEQLMVEAPNAPTNSPDPYGDISESIFTLFRMLTGEDWTDLRYNLITASEYDLVPVNSAVITTYHVSWFCLAAFLLLNLVTGAVLNNYQLALNDKENEKGQDKQEV